MKYLEADPPVKPAKKLSQEGEEMYAKFEREWRDKREPWPVGLADVTEVVPMKLREEDDERGDSFGKLRFDRDRHRFIDVEAQMEAEKPAVTSFWYEPI